MAVSFKRAIRTFGICAFSSIATAAIVTSPATAKARRHPNPMTLHDIGQNIIRSVDYDLCMPADAEEYEAIGKNAVLRLNATSALSTELPLQRVYLSTKGLKVPLRKLFDRPAHKTGVSDDPLKPADRWEQPSFYLVPINLIKAGGNLLADFRGPRSGFEVGSLAMRPTSEPFLRLDEYDTPSDPDAKALAALLVREYPDDFASQ